MEQKSFKELIEKLNSDESLQKEFSKKKNIDDMYKFCTSIVGGYTREEFEEFINQIYNSINQKIKSGEISEEELSRVNGGGFFGSDTEENNVIVRTGGTYTAIFHQAEETKARTAAMMLTGIGSIGSVALGIFNTVYTMIQEKKQKKQTEELLKLYGNPGTGGGLS